jgi:hypothetical protein
MRHAFLTKLLRYIEAMICTEHLLLPNIVYNLCKLYNEAVCLIEAMSTGAQIATILLHDLEYEGVLTTTLKGRNGQRIGGGSGDMRLGVQMNKQVKRIGCTNLKALIEDDKIVLNDERIVKELFTFVVKDTAWLCRRGRAQR